METPLGDHELDAMMDWHKGDGQQVFWDEISGKPLPPTKVRSAMKEEVDFLESWKVWNEVPISRCWESVEKVALGTFPFSRR